MNEEQRENVKRAKYEEIMDHHNERMTEHRRRMDSIAATPVGTPLVDIVNDQVEREKERKIAQMEFESMEKKLEEDVDNDEEEEQRENVKRAKYEEIMAHHNERTAEHRLRIGSIVAPAGTPFMDTAEDQVEREKERKIAQMEFENMEKDLEEDVDNDEEEDEDEEEEQI